MRFFLLLFLSLSLFAREGGSLYLSFKSFISNNAVSLKDITGDWSGSYKSPKGGFKALVLNDYKIGYKERLFSLSYVLKSEIISKASSDFADLVHSVKQGEQLDVGRNYDLQLSLKGFVADGIEYERELYRYKKDGLYFDLRGTLSLLHGLFLQNAEINGYAKALGKKSYAFLAGMEYYYSSNYIYDLDVDKPTALGYSTDLKIEGGYGKYDFLLKIENLMGYLYWKDTPYSDVHLKSQNEEVDENGYTKYNPTVYGYEGKRRYKQHLMPKYTAKIGCSLGEYNLFLKNVHIEKIDIFSLGAVKSFRDFLLFLEYDTRFHTVTTALSTDNLSLTLGFENISLPKSKSLEIGVSYRYVFE